MQLFKVGIRPRLPVALVRALIIPTRTIALLVLAAGCELPPIGGTAESSAIPKTASAETPQEDPFKAAISKAQSAANLTQKASSWEQWNQIAAQWKAAIALLETVPNTDVNRALAQQKIAEYQKNLAYAQQQVYRFDPFTQAQLKAQIAVNLGKNAASKDRWNDVAFQWQEAIAQLESIPNNHSKKVLAQEKITEYEKNLAYVRQQLAEFDPFNQALKKAKNAANLTQNAASMQQWEQVVLEWKEAIALLKSVPPNHSKYKSSQEKFRQYKYNLAYAQQQVSRTDPYERAIAQAKNATELAESASSMQQWNEVATQWQAAIALIESVPKTHEKTRLIQPMLSQYKQNMAWAKQQAALSDPFKQAMSKGKTAFTLAQSATSNYDWNVVISEWQAAIALLENVPPGHSKSTVAQQKIAEYRKNIQYAEQQARVRLLPISTEIKPPSPAAQQQ